MIPAPSLKGPRLSSLLLTVTQSAVAFSLSPMADDPTDEQLNAATNEFMTYYVSENVTVYIVWRSTGELDEALADFVQAKADANGAIGGLHQEDDSDACVAIIAAAHEAMETLAYDYTKTPAENLAAVDAIVTKAEADLTAQREADAAAAEAAANRAAADAVTAKIAAIGTVEYTDASKAKIDAARTAYDA